MNTLKERSALNRVYLDVLLNNLKKKGFYWLIKRITIRASKELGWLLLLPLSCSLHLLGFRRIDIRIEHIGNMTEEFDTFLKAQKLHLIPVKYYFVLAPKNKISNKHILDYWRDHFNIVSNRIACIFLDILSRHYFVKSKISLHLIDFFGTQGIYKVNQLWDGRPPLLKLRQTDEEWGSDMLKKLGIPKHQWFVCVHVREGGFLPHNESIQSHRNASIAHTIPAAKEIIRRGGMVVRMGDETMTSIEKMEGMIDYAHHPLKSERLDVILCAKAKFFLGCTSGLAFLSMIFGVPIAHANMVSLSTLGIRSSDINIPKLLWSNSQKRYLTFKEIMNSDIGNFYFTHQYRDANIILEENASEDILCLVNEMLDRLDGTFVEHPSDSQLHAQYMSLFKPGHYSYGAVSKICVAFLKKYQHLL